QRAECNQDTLRRLDAFEIPKPAAKIHRVNETAASEHGAAHATANAKQRYPASGKFARSAVPQETTNRVGDHEKSQGGHHQLRRQEEQHRYPDETAQDHHGDEPSQLGDNDVLSHAQSGSRRSDKIKERQERHYLGYRHYLSEDRC